MMFMRSDSDAKSRTEKVYIEPGCSISEVVVKTLDADRVSLEFPNDDGMTKKALEALGIKGKKCVIVFKRAQTGEYFSKILEIRGE
jgi:hypothetical protein